MQVSVNDEGRDMWKVYLDMKEYAAALSNCRDPLQRDQVYLVQVAFVANKVMAVLVLDFYYCFFVMKLLLLYLLCIEKSPLDLGSISFFLFDG